MAEINTYLIVFFTSIKYQFKSKDTQIIFIINIISKYYDKPILYWWDGLCSCIAMID